jgi:cation transport ATPase
VSHYEQRYRKLEGVSAVRGSHITGTLLIVYDPSRVKLAKILYVLYQVNDYKESPLQTQTARASHDKSPHGSSLRRQFAGILATGTILGVLVFQRFLTRWFSFMGGLLVRIISSATALLAGIPVFREGLEDMMEHKRLSLDFMVSMAAVIAIVVGEGLVALEVVWLMNCGTFLEDFTAERSRRAIRKLLEKELAGLIGVVDRPRQEAFSVIQGLQRSGIHIYLLTGDHQKTADAVSRQLGIEHYYYNMLPEDKARMIEKLRAEGMTVAMVGDGVNDALAFAKSDLGIAMGAGDSDVAVEAADIALKANDLTRLPALRELSQKTMKVIRQNYVYSMGINALGIGLGAAGRISPLMGGVLHVMNSIGVILNSSRILLIKDR